MRTPPAIPIGFLVLATLSSACNRKLVASAIEQSPAAIAQKGHLGTSTWVVGSDGAVSGTLKDPDGKPITQPITGQVAFAVPGGAPTSVPVQYDPSTGVLTAAGPKLEADITPVSYALSVNGKPWNGTLEVPKGGTADLADAVKLQPPLPPHALGPNGGVVQMVGPDRVELVANRSNGDVRAYVLDADEKPVDPGDRKISIALEGDAPDGVVLLEPEPEGHFVVGHVRARLDPARVTIAVNAHGRTHACLVGWSPGSVVVVGPEAPRVHLFAVEAWPNEVVELHGRHGRHHGDVVVGEPGLVVGAPGVVVEGPSVVVGGPSVVVGGPGVVLGGPGLVGGGAVHVGGVVGGHEHDREHERGGGGHHGR